MDLCVLCNRLRLVSIKRDSLPHCTHFLLKFLVFPDQTDRFVSMTETEDEVSLILDDVYLREMLPHCEQWLEVVPSTWCAMQLIVGSVGQTASGIVSSMAKPLADCGISIFQLSTYESDYVMVEESKLYAALRAVQSRFPVKVVFPDDFEPDEGGHSRRSSEDDAESPTSSFKTKRNSPPGTLRVAPVNGSSTLSRSPPKRLRPFTVTNYRIYLGSIDRDNVERCSGVLTRLLFYTNTRRFFSLTRNGDFISVMLDGDAFSQFPEDAINAYPEAWAVVRVADGPLGFEECGIVAEFASTLANANVSIFYLSTFLTDYILVGAGDLNKAVAALSSRFNSD